MSKFDWQWTLGQAEHGPHAMFIWRDGHFYSDSLICSGIIPMELGGKPCPYSEGGRMPKPQPVNVEGEQGAPLKGKVGELCPSCMARHYGSLRNWATRGERPMPEELLDLRVFRCHQFFWLVVPGLKDGDATVIDVPKPPDAPDSASPPLQTSLFEGEDVSPAED